MTVGPCGYGRYNDDPEHVGCPRARSDMTPCIARDGCSALADDVDIRLNPNGAADQLRDVVRRVTEPGVLK
jgi:hypothetical protein